MALFRTRKLTISSEGFFEWIDENTETKVIPKQTAVIVCDVWDHHWSRAAEIRLQRLIAPMNNFLCAMRDKGAKIIHAPSDTISFYKDSPARARLHDCIRLTPESLVVVHDVPMPVDASDGGSDSSENAERVNERVWTRQHSGIIINEALDGISDSGEEIYSFLRHNDISRVFMLGVHTNMCILNRSFGIKNLIRHGLEPVLMRDLTDLMYNPAMPPYVSHDEGLRLVVEYIEKFYCPSACAAEILRELE